MTTCEQMQGYTNIHTHILCIFFSPFLCGLLGWPFGTWWRNIWESHAIPWWIGSCDWIQIWVFCVSSSHTEILTGSLCKCPYSSTHGHPVPPCGEISSWAWGSPFPDSKLHGKRYSLSLVTSTYDWWWWWCLNRLPFMYHFWSLLACWYSQPSLSRPSKPSPIVLSGSPFARKWRRERSLSFRILPNSKHLPKSLERTGILASCFFLFSFSYIFWWIRLISGTLLIQLTYPIS